MPPLTASQSEQIAFIKHLVTSALDEAERPEPFCCRAILGFHDAVELFLEMVAEVVGADVSKKVDVLAYWPAIKEKGVDLPEKQSMKRLNQARVGLKHSGIRPTRDQVNELSFHTVEFFDASSKLVFGVPLSSLSLVSLVGYEPAASRLRHAENQIKHDLAIAVQLSGVAFEEILSRFRRTQGDWPGTPFPKLHEASRFRAATGLGYEFSRDFRDLAEHLETAGEAFSEIYDALMMFALGVDVRRSSRFRKLARGVTFSTNDGTLYVPLPADSLSDAGARFAIDFVTQAAVRVREFDPDPPPLGHQHAFQASERFRVSVVTEQRAVPVDLTGILVAIGGGWEAWVLRDGRLSRIWPSKQEEEVLKYLANFKTYLLRDERGIDVAASQPGDPPGG